MRERERERLTKRAEGLELGGMRIVEADGVGMWGVRVLGVVSVLRALPERELPVFFFVR